MKKTVLFLFLALAFLGNSCKKDETPEFNNISTERKSLLIDFTATWCCPCGGSQPIFKEIQARYPYKVVPLAVHAQNDPFYNADMLNFGIGAYELTGLPTYVGDNKVINWGYINNRLDTSDFYNVIKTTLAEAPACGIGINKSISGNKMSISTRTLFFRQTTGKLSLAIYITEDGLQHEQNCYSESVHNHVFRASLTNSDETGKLLINGTVEKGQAFDNSFTFDIPSDYVKNNLHVIAVVYQLDPSPSASKPLAILNVNNI